MNPTRKRNFAVFPVLDWIAAIMTHIPNKGEQRIRYYGTYRNVSRGKRKKEKPKREEAVSCKPEVIEVPPPSISKGASASTSLTVKCKHLPYSNMVENTSWR